MSHAAAHVCSITNIPSKPNFTVTKIFFSDSEKEDVPSFISANVIIGATAIVLCLALAYSVFRLRRCRLNPMAKTKNDSLNEDPELNSDANETNKDCLDVNCSLYHLNDHEVCFIDKFYCKIGPISFLDLYYCEIVMYFRNHLDNHAIMRLN